MTTHDESITQPGNWDVCWNFLLLRSRWSSDCNGTGIIQLRKANTRETGSMLRCWLSKNAIDRSIRYEEVTMFSINSEKREQINSPLSEVLGKGQLEIDVCYFPLWHSRTKRLDHCWSWRFHLSWQLRILHQTSRELDDRVILSYTSNVEKVSTAS